MVSLDLWYLFVENVFGNFFLAVVGLSIIFAVIMMIGRLSTISMTFIVVSFIGILGTGYVGALFAVPLFIISATYFIFNLISFLVGISSGT